MLDNVISTSSGVSNHVAELSTFVLLCLSSASKLSTSLSEDHGRLKGKTKKVSCTKEIRIETELTLLHLRNHFHLLSHSKPEDLASQCVFTEHYY